MVYTPKHPEHTFIEEIDFCPTQIYYFFTDTDNKHWCAYIRQRRQPEATFELVATDELQEFSDDYQIGPYISLSRIFNFNVKAETEMINEIHAMENEVLEWLRTRFPNVNFPNNPPRQTRHPFIE